MDSPLITGALLMIILGVQLGHCVKDQLFTFDTQQPEGFDPSHVQIEDKDGKGVMPRITVLQNQILVRTKTMPDKTNFNAPTFKEDNLVYFPYITNPTDTEMVEISYTFNHEESCPSYSSHSSPVQCYDHLTLLLVATTSNQPINSIDLSNPLHVTNVTSSMTTDEQRKELIQIPAGTQGYRLVLHDQGSGFLLKLLTISRYHCQYNPSARSLPISCQNSPANVLRNNTVRCDCTDSHSEPDSGRSTISEVCVYESKFDIAHFIRSSIDASTVCVCQPGYFYAISTNGGRHCKVKPTTTPATSTIVTTKQPTSSFTASPGWTLSPGLTLSPGSTASTGSTGAASQTPVKRGTSPSLVITPSSIPSNPTAGKSPTNPERKPNITKILCGNKKTGDICNGARRLGASWTAVSAVALMIIINAVVRF